MSPPSLDCMQQHDSSSVLNHHPLRGMSYERRASSDDMLVSSSASNNGDLSMFELAYQEVAQLRLAEQEAVAKAAAAASRQSSSSSRSASPLLFLVKFPPACLALVVNGTKGNRSCVDCGARNPQWATVSYGALLCLQCSGHHRSLGVQVSCVRSLYMDDWSLSQILALLEGGNAQVQTFFARHLLCQTTTTTNTNTAATTTTNTTNTNTPPPQGLSSLSSPPSSPTTTSCITPTNVTRLRYKTKAALFYRQHLALHVQQILQAPGPYQGRQQQQQRRPKKTSSTTTQAHSTSPPPQTRRSLRHCSSTVD